MLWALCFFYSFYSSDLLFIVLYKCTSSNVQNSIYQIKARVQITINHTKQIEKERVKTTPPKEKKNIFFHLCIYLFIESHKVEYNTRKKNKPGKKAPYIRRSAYKCMQIFVLWYSTAWRSGWIYQIKMQRQSQSQKYGWNSNTLKFEHLDCFRTFTDTKMQLFVCRFFIVLDFFWVFI